MKEMGFYFICNCFVLVFVGLFLLLCFLLKKVPLTFVNIQEELGQAFLAQGLLVVSTRW